MKTLIITISLVALSQFTFAQKGSFVVGVKINPASNVATVDDNDGRKSKDNYTSDGVTSKTQNESGIAAVIFIDYYKSNTFAISSGLGITQKNFNITNTDGSYHGSSVYQANYLQIPLLLKYVSKEFKPNLKYYINAGPTFNFRMSEKLVGGDGAHYWNMANNFTDLDKTRGKNASGKAMPLFNAFDISVYLSGGVSYKLLDDLDAFGGIMLDFGLMNLVNSDLKFTDANQTKVNSGTTWRSNLIGFELGFAYKIK